MITGVTRAIDSLGRIVIPKEIRKSMRLTEGSMIDFTADPIHDVIQLRPMRLQCVCCGNQSEAALRSRRGVLVCLSCLDAMREEVAP